MTEYNYLIAISAGPCQFCDWEAGQGGTPSIAYDPNNPEDAVLACPKCGFELLGQTLLKKEEYEKILKDKEKTNV